MSVSGRTIPAGNTKSTTTGTPLTQPVPSNHRVGWAGQLIGSADGRNGIVNVSGQRRDGGANCGRGERARDVVQRHRQRVGERCAGRCGARRSQAGFARLAGHEDGHLGQLARARCQSHQIAKLPRLCGSETQTGHIPRRGTDRVVHNDRCCLSDRGAEPARHNQSERPDGDDEANRPPPDFGDTSEQRSTHMVLW